MGASHGCELSLPSSDFLLHDNIGVTCPCLFAPRFAAILPAASRNGEYTTMLTTVCDLESPRDLVRNVLYIIRHLRGLCRQFLQPLAISFIYMMFADADNGLVIVHGVFLYRKFMLSFTPRPSGRLTTHTAAYALGPKAEAFAYNCPSVYLTSSWTHWWDHNIWMRFPDGPIHLLRSRYRRTSPHAPSVSTRFIILSKESTPLPITLTLSTWRRV